MVNGILCVGRALALLQAKYASPPPGILEESKVNHDFFVTRMQAWWSLAPRAMAPGAQSSPLSVSVPTLRALV